MTRVWGECDPYVTQLLESLVAHLSVLAHPVCVIPTGSFPYQLCKHTVCLLFYDSPLNSILRMTKTRNDSLYLQQLINLN